MKNIILTLSLLLVFAAGFAQTPFTATYTFGSDGNVASFTYNGTTYGGFIMGTIDKVGVTTSSSSNNFRATGWSTGAIDTGKYIGITMTAASGYNFTVNTIDFGVGRSGTGIRDTQWRGSSDSYAALINNYTTLNSGLTNNSGVLNNPDANSNWTGNVLTLGSSYADISTSCGFRMYMYSAEATTGTAGLTGPITIAGTFQAPAATPTITVAPATLSGFTYVFGSGPSEEKSFTISGSNLTANISISVPIDYEISTGSGGSFSATNPITLTPSGGTVSTSNIYVRLKAGLAIGDYSVETVTASSSGATDQTVTCNGTVTSLTPPPAPTATTATNVTNNSFTANWNAVTGATGYYLDVYTSSTGSLATDLFISEYVEGSSYNKYIEIYNGTGSSVDLSNYKLELFSNGAAAANPSNVLSGTLAQGSAIVYKNSGATLTLPTGVTAENNTAVNHNGDDAIALYKISTSSYVDIFGRIGDDPGTAWTGSGNYTTVGKTLVRNSSVTGGVSTNPTGTGASAFTTLTTEWTMYDEDTATYLGSHTMNAVRTVVYVPGYNDRYVGNVTSYEVTGLAENTQYHYLVRAVNSFGTSDNSNVIDVTTTSGSSAPTIPARDIIGYPGNSSISLEWTPGNGAYRVVKINTSNSFTAPANGSSPTANTFYTGSGEQVVFNGATEDIEGSPFDGCTVTNLAPNTVYWFRIYEYNGSGVDTKYLTGTAANNPKSITTTSSSGSGYYANISGYGTTLKGLLNTLIQGSHTTKFSYDALKTQIPYTDEDPNNSNNLIEIYTGWSVPKSSFGGGVTQWNREHTWSKSHGDFGDVAPAGTDLHHLRPCDATVNSTKSNKDFAMGGTAVTDNSPPSGYTGVTGCYQTSDTWEPRDEDKGDVARMIMYMAVRYEGTDSNVPNLELVDHVFTDQSSNLPYYGKLATLLQWHAEDPPDAWETRRNNRIAERQGNRNPFIDIPGYAARIWAPCPLNNTNITTTSFTGNWSIPITATNYWLQVATDSLFTNIVSGYNGADSYDVDLLTSKNISGLSAGGTYYYRLRSYFESDFGMWSPYLEVILQSPVTASASITPSQTLEEVNLNGATLTFVLSDATFIDSVLLLTNFTLNNAPSGLSVQSVSYENSTTALITLAFTGTDFDVNYPTFSVTIAAAEISVSYSVTSNAIIIHAHVEGTATIALDGANIRITITPVAGAVSYIVYGSSEPYDTYLDISSTGNFGATPQNNIWLIPAEYFLMNRHFFKVSAVL